MSIQFRVYQLTYVRLSEVERGEPDGFVITAGGPREARRIAHEYRSTSGRQKYRRDWMYPSFTKIRMIGTSPRRTPEVHMVSYVSA